MKYEQKDYLVSEVARFYGVCGDTIRHYDRKKILNARKKENSNYRVYDRDDFILMDHIMSLRKMDTPLEEIYKIINEYSLEDMEEFFCQRQIEVEKEIQRMHSVQAMISRYKNAIVRAKEAENTIVVREMPACICKMVTTSASATKEYFEELHEGLLPVLTFVSVEGSLLDPAFIEKMQDAEERAQMVEHAFTAFDYEDVHKKENFPTEEFKILPPGRYLHLFKRVHIHSDYGWGLEFAEYVKKHNLKNTGNLFGRMLGTQDAEKIDYYEFWLPIE